MSESLQIYTRLVIETSVVNLTGGQGNLGLSVRSQLPFLSGQGLIGS